MCILSYNIKLLIYCFQQLYLWWPWSFVFMHMPLQKEGKPMCNNVTSWGLLGSFSMCLQGVKWQCIACLWNLEWVASLRLIHSPVVKWGGGEPTLRFGSETGTTCYPDGIESKAGGPVWISPPSTLALNTGLMCLAAWLSPRIKGFHLGFLSLSLLTYVPCAPLVPKHLLEQILVPLNQYCIGGIWEGISLKAHQV